jgi:hypothetical protein
MNDKQKDIALEMGKWACRCIATGDIGGGSARAKMLNKAYEDAADAPKRKPTTKDIAKYRLPDGDWCIKCRGYGWTFNGWNSYGAYNPLTELTASIVYAGLVATGNVPEVGE